MKDISLNSVHLFPGRGHAAGGLMSSFFFVLSFSIKSFVVYIKITADMVAYNELFPQARINSDTATSEEFAM